MVEKKILDYHDDMAKKQQPAISSELLFFVLGYGIPKDILEDQNYEIYLRTVFNTIFDTCAKAQSWNATIVFSGGKTDMWAPYRRTEAQEMKRAFQVLMKRPAVKRQTKTWKLLLEANSLSTLDNFVYIKQLVNARTFSAKQITIFCEQTRFARVKALARTLFAGARVHPVDFDQSANRYLEPATLERLSTEGLKLDRWALKNARNLAKHRELFKEKLVFLRKAGPDAHVDAVRRWWELQLQKLEDT